MKDSEKFAEKFVRDKLRYKMYKQNQLTGGKTKVDLEKLNDLFK